MSLKTPASRYRPTRVSDGEGGFTETNGVAVTIYGAIRVHQNVTTFICDRHDDVKPGDILLVESAYYRVTDSDRTAATRLKALTIERTERPIFPNA